MGNMPSRWWAIFQCKDCDIYVGSWEVYGESLHQCMTLRKSSCHHLRLLEKKPPGMTWWLLHQDIEVQVPALAPRQGIIDGQKRIAGPWYIKCQCQSKDHARVWDSVQEWGCPLLGRALIEAIIEVWMWLFAVQNKLCRLYLNLIELTSVTHWKGGFVRLCWGIIRAPPNTPHLHVK